MKSLVKARIARLSLIGACFCFCISPVSIHAQRVRSVPFFPNLPGYVTLRGDFHAHTVFSDGNVWPTVRPEEAWREGYDVLAITDHLEYLPHKSDMILTNFNRSYELARPTAQALGMVLIHAAELTRGEPPGHWNLLFLTNANTIPTKDYHDALKAARQQDAFVFWNHPGWKQPERKSVWYAEQQEALTNGWLQGIEIVNGHEYDPIAFGWCLEKKLTPFGNSDIHNPVALDYAYPPGAHRPMTLVFAREKAVDAIKAALRERRTAVYFENQLYGEARFLKPIFEQSLEVETPELTMANKGRAVMQVHNRCAVTFELKANGKVAGLSFPSELTLYSGKTVAFDVRRTGKELESGATIRLPYTVENLVVAPDTSLQASLDFKLKTPPKKK